MCMWLQGQGIEAAAGTEAWCAGQAVSAVEPGHRALAEAKSAQGAGVGGGMPPYQDEALGQTPGTSLQGGTRNPLGK